MKLSRFCLMKPDQLRMGQWFYNCYLYKLGWNDKMHHSTQQLYNTNNPMQAVLLIQQIMSDYQWTELPELTYIDGHWRCL